MRAQHGAQEHVHVPGQLGATGAHTQEDELLSLSPATTGTLPTPREAEVGVSSW